MCVVGPTISRVKRDFPLCSHWECDIDKVFAMHPPSYQLTREYMPVSTKVPTGGWPRMYMCVCESVCSKLWPKGLFGQVLAELVTLPFPALEPALYSSHACYSQYQRHYTHKHTHTNRHTQPMHTYTQSIILTLTTGAVCKQRPVDSKIQLCRLPTLSQAVC